MNDMTKNELIVEGCRSMAFQDLRDTLSAALDDRDATIAALRAEVAHIPEMAKQLGILKTENEQLRAEVERLKEVSRWYDKTRQDMAKMLGRDEWEQTHGLDFTTLIGRELTQLREDRGVLVVDEPDENGVELHKTLSASFPWVWRKGESYWCRYKKVWRVGRDKQGEYQNLSEAFGDYPNPNSSGALGGAT